MKNKKLVRGTLFSAGIGLMASCTTLSYSPTVSLDVSPQTIKKIVMVEKFTDHSSPKDQKNPLGGYSVTNHTALSNDLSLEVTNALITDFSNNSVFSQVSRKPEHPDFILKGEIKHYLGKSRYNTFGLVSLFSMAGVLTWYLGIPIRINETNIELTVTMHSPDGKLLGTYTGQYKDRVNTSMYRNISLSIPSQANKSFSNVVSQIRSELLTDVAKYN